MQTVVNTTPIPLSCMAICIHACFGTVLCCSVISYTCVTAKQLKLAFGIF